VRSFHSHTAISRNASDAISTTGIRKRHTSAWVSDDSSMPTVAESFGMPMSDKSMA
jgi:hypothetical protein